MGQLSSFKLEERTTDADAADACDDCFEQIVAAFPIAVVLTDQAGEIQFANRRALECFGYAEADLTGSSLDLLLPNRLHKEPAKSHLLHGGHLPDQIDTLPQRSFPQFWQGRHQDGHEFPVALTRLPLANENDIGAAYVIERCIEPVPPPVELVHSESSLRQIVENTTAVVYVKDLEGRYLLVNSQFERLFHLGRDEIRGRTDFDLFPKPMAQAFRDNDTHVAGTGQTLVIDEIALHDDGPHTYVSVKFPLRDQQDRVYAVAGISTDITDRVRAEVDAGELRSRLEVILNSINNGIVGLNGEGEVTFANPAAQRLLQADTSDLGRLMPSIAMDIATCSEDMGAAETVHSEMQETRLRRSDGTSFHAEFRVFPVVEHGRQQGAVVSFRDVTDRKRREAIERQLQSARAVQQILYPHTWPSCPGLDIAGHVYSADTMCGDYLDFIRTGEEEMTIAVGDVSGHGFGPALQMVETRACLRAMLKSGHSLAESVSVLNNLLNSDIPTESFITLFAAKIDLPTLTLSCVTAGHAAWLFREGTTPQRITGNGLVLGIEASQQYTSSVPYQLQSGDTLLLPTDGVQETQNTRRDLFGIDRMLQTVLQFCDRSAVEIVDNLYHATTEFAGPRRQSDDVTIAVVKVV